MSQHIKYEHIGVQGGNGIPQDKTSIIHATQRTKEICRSRCINPHRRATVLFLGGSAPQGLRLLRRPSSAPGRGSHPCPWTSLSRALLPRLQPSPSPAAASGVPCAPQCERMRWPTWLQRARHGRRQHWRMPGADAGAEVSCETVSGVGHSAAGFCCDYDVSFCHHHWWFAVCHGPRRIRRTSARRGPYHPVAARLALYRNSGCGLCDDSRG